MTALVEVVRRFRRLRALTIGDVMLDSYLEGSAAGLCTEGPVPVVRRTLEQRLPGGAANTAANLRALGAGVDLLGIVGPDAAGGLLAGVLRERGVDPRWLVEDPDARTLHKLRILADGQYVVRFDEGDTLAATPQAEARLLTHLEETYLRCHVVVISDYRYGVLSDALLARLRALRVAAPRVLLVDSKALHRYGAAGATVVTPDHLEARLLVEPGRAATHAGTRPTVAEMEATGRRLLEHIDAECVAITMGGGGVCLVPRGGETTHVPAHPVQRANDVGAGDSFAAAMALALAAGAAPTAAAQVGIAAAGIAVARPRTAVVAHQDLLRRVSLQDHAAPAGDRSSLTRLAARLNDERAAGRCIVFTNGVFDILHAGHVEFLRQAKALGDVLVVGVNTDRSVRRLKGERRPINPERDRLALVAALDAVDHAVLFDEDTPARLIRALRPQLHVKGGDYAEAPLPEAEAVHAVGGRIAILPLVGSLSTTALIDRIVARVGDGTPGGTL